MRCALACAVFAGCVPVSWRVSPTDVQAAAPTLRREGSAVVHAEKIDDGPSDKASSASATELIRLDQPISVQLAAQALPWYHIDSEPLGAPQTMTVADLFADCPDDLDNSEANRRASPRCKLFRASDIELRRGHRADKSQLVFAGGLVAAAGDIVCVAECERHVAGAALGVGVAALGVGVVVWFLYELTKGDHKHDY